MWNKDFIPVIKTAMEGYMGSFFNIKAFPTISQTCTQNTHIHLTTPVENYLEQKLHRNSYHS